MKLLEIILVTDRRFTNRDAEKLRGYFGNSFIDKVEFHNHKDEFSFNYASPLIQYRVVNGKLSILGIDKGADILLSCVENIKEINISGEVIPVKPEIKISFPNLEIADEMKYKYKFESLWFALNAENYKKYQKGELDLSRQVANNIIEFFKMCGVWADKKIEVVGDFKEEDIRQKDITIKGFYGEFMTNVNLPDNISLGKRKSIGLGRIKKLM